MADQTHDLQGNAYATVEEVKAGTILKCDGDFTCIPTGSLRTVKADSDGDLYIECDEGPHLLDGQTSEDGKTYVGLYLASNAPSEMVDGPARELARPTT